MLRITFGPDAELYDKCGPSYPPPLFTAFHWLDPDVRMIKAADLLRPDGSLGIVSTHHIAGGTNAFFADAQRCYERFDPTTPPACA
ncbi:hypothetical protein [Paractinoplanes toevensis]|uniref:Uncharacterized protein n=1 Tax=Paractinoplanes toevensis TaxID=571911 RepID=A0A920BR36_9ACTN|nr:hypothetical protein [Actinoplanes toevensis]GIM98067.1 hypothetical protein Ato02nite_098600 [Actinoplanes toevensis]